MRHCHADISRISAHGYSPRVSFEEALEEFCSWSRDKPTQDLFEEAAREMDSRGLVR